MITAGVIRTKPSYPLEHRLVQIANELRAVIKQYAPQAVSVEQVFHAVNAKSALKLAHVRGVALLLAAEAGMPVSEYSPLEVKISVVGYGRAEKHQVEMMVQSLLAIDRRFHSYDATDALAVAICHGARMNFPIAAGAER
jgi:crossover junction endodeoxyribonuclease RuvC